MSAIIIGGNECMGRTYCELCAKYNITARAIPLKKGSSARKFLIQSLRAAFCLSGIVIIQK